MTAIYNGGRTDNVLLLNAEKAPSKLSSVIAGVAPEEGLWTEEAPLRDHRGTPFAPPPGMLWPNL